MSTIPLNSKFLKELLNSTNLTARLFTNNLLNCEDIPSPIQFEEASFDGYSPRFLNPLLWSPVSQAIGSYTKYRYLNKIIWKNLGPATIVAGYYVTDQNNKVLWFEKFDNEIALNQNEGTLVNMEVEMNNYDFPKTTITLVIKNSNVIPQNITVSTQNIKWGEIDYNNSFIDLLSDNFTPRNNIICIGVKDTIKPCQEEILQFDLTVSAQGFETHQENISITNQGNNILYIYLNRLALTTTNTPAVLPPDPFQGLLSIGIVNDIYDLDTSSILDKILIKVYKPKTDQFQGINIDDISFNLIAASSLFDNDSLPDQLQNSENFTEMKGIFSFTGGDSGTFTITNTTTIPSQNGNTTFFSGTMDGDSTLGKWVSGDIFSAELTFKNLDLLIKIINQEETRYYLVLNDFNFNVSGIRYYSNPIN